MMQILRPVDMGRRLAALSIFWALASASPVLRGQTAVGTPVYRWTTLAGLATTGYNDDANARFNNPHGVALDPAGNAYVADTANHTIRKVTPQGNVTTLAGSPNQPGSADGIGGAARFLLPEGVAVDAAGNVYVTDTGNYTVRKITPDGAVTTLAGQAGQRGTVDGPAQNARFSNPGKIYADSLGNVYVIDNGLRRISAGTVSTVPLAGPLVLPTGETVEVSTLAFRGPPAVDANGQVYISVSPFPVANWKRIIKRDPTGAYSIIASSVASDNRPFISTETSEVAMTTDGAGNLYVVTKLVSSIIEYSLLKISPAGVLTRPRWGGLNRGGTGDEPLGLAADATERILHTNSLDDVLLLSTPAGSAVLAGIPWSNLGANGSAAVARFASIDALAIDRTGTLLVGDSLTIYNIHFAGAAQLRKVSATGDTSTFYSTHFNQSPSLRAAGVAVDPSDNIIFNVGAARDELRLIAPDGSGTDLASGDFININAMGADSAGRLLVADNQRRVFRRSATGEWSVLAGANQTEEFKDGTGADARFAQIISLAVAANGDAYVLDRMITPTLRVVVRRIQPTGTVTTISGNLVKGTDTAPQGIAIDAKGDFLLTYNDDTVRLLPASGSEVIIGGSPGQAGTRNGDGQAAQFYLPGAITADPQNNLYVADNAGVVIRKGAFLGYAATITTQPQSLTVAPGGSAQFSVVATSTPAPSYQWQFNGAAINGATGSTLTIPAVSPANAGNYTVIVANTLGTVTSNVATLTVKTSGQPPAAGGSGGGGGGAPSPWFLGALLALTLARTLRRR